MVIGRISLVIINHYSIHDPYVTPRVKKKKIKAIIYLFVHVDKGSRQTIVNYPLLSPVWIKDEKEVI